MTPTNSPIWQYATTNTATTATSTYVVNRPTTISIAPTTPVPKGPLEWLREQVEEVCQLARVP